jgi:NitT/TauT family transport system substrate-binding protein
LNPIVSLSVRPESLDKRNVKPSDPLEKRLAAIKGMTIAVSGEGSVTDTALQLMIKQASLAPTDVTKVNIDAHPARLAAMQAGQIDGFVAGAPLDVVTERSKDALIFIDAHELAEMKDFVFETYYGTADWVNAHPDEIQAFNRAIVKANKYLRDSPDAPKLLVDNEFKSVELSALAESLNRMKPGIPADGKMTQAGWNGVMRFALAGGLIKQEIDVSEGTYWTNKYLE